MNEQRIFGRVLDKMTGVVLPGQRFVGSVKCPHCSHEQTRYLKLDFEPQVFYCDIEDDGCDDYFVVLIRNQSVMLDMYTLKKEEM